MNVLDKVKLVTSNHKLKSIIDKSSEIHGVMTVGVGIGFEG